MDSFKKPNVSATLSGTFSVSKCRSHHSGFVVYAYFGKFNKTFWSDTELEVGKIYEFSGYIYTKKLDGKYYENIHMDWIAPVEEPDNG